VSASPLREAVLAAADAVEAARDDLCRLDAVAGDGDHGVTMALAARAVREALAAAPGRDGADLLGQVAAAVASVGGAIGPLYATGLLRASAVVRSWPPDRTIRSEDLLEVAQQVEAAIAALGGARPGDKTVLDAIDPMTESLRAAASTVQDARVAAERAATAAAAGAAATSDMVASVGRASRLGERGRGSPDPGATSFAIIVDAAVRSWLGRRGG
jgi:dihydroxyacetone kinase phosphoprotein-dependent L subunit